MRRTYTRTPPLRCMLLAVVYHVSTNCRKYWNNETKDGKYRTGSVKVRLSRLRCISYSAIIYELIRTTFVFRKRQHTYRSWRSLKRNFWTPWTFKSLKENLSFLKMDSGTWKSLIYNNQFREPLEKSKNGAKYTRNVHVIEISMWQIKIFIMVLWLPWTMVLEVSDMLDTE